MTIFTIILFCDDCQHIEENWDGGFYDRQSRTISKTIFADFLPNEAELRDYLQQQIIICLFRLERTDVRGVRRTQIQIHQIYLSRSLFM